MTALYPRYTAKDDKVGFFRMKWQFSETGRGQPTLGEDETEQVHGEGGTAGWD
ncbi:hypothetical protein [Nonomuraea aurantiaca]|uniref:hypothetical protein n=1 Tax=Nonomuraea aurantiaca TaxID=2878562 RepID=UPI001CD98C42|nr:hypothetical protein [Nonomuraea aurantiaca]MCA2222468.1 hypothetical protein [Nonomuraea aurantiaca]